MSRHACQPAPSRAALPYSSKMSVRVSTVPLPSGCSSKRNVSSPHVYSRTRGGAATSTVPENVDPSTSPNSTVSPSTNFPRGAPSGNHSFSPSVSVSACHTFSGACASFRVNCSRALSPTRESCPSSCMRSSSVGDRVEMTFEVVEMPRPLRAVRREPVVERLQGFCLQSIYPSLRVRTRLHETRVAQHLQVLRHRGLAHGEGGHEFADRPLAVEQQVEDAPPVGFGEHVEEREIQRRGHL